jgi:hypothetical protein
MISRLTLIFIICTYLTSCIAVKEEPAITVVEPMIPNPPKLSDYTALYGERDGGKLFVHELKRYVDYVNLYLDHLSEEYMLVLDLEKTCLKPPTAELVKLPSAPRLANDMSYQAIDDLTSYIEEIAYVVDTYNSAVTVSRLEYEECIN